jgi:hypothetical protein
MAPVRQKLALTLEVCKPNGLPPHIKHTHEYLGCCAQLAVRLTLRVTFPMWHEHGAPQSRGYH